MVYKFHLESTIKVSKPYQVQQYHALITIKVEVEHKPKSSTNSEFYSVIKMSSCDEHEKR